MLLTNVNLHAMIEIIYRGGGRLDLSRFDVALEDFAQKYIVACSS